MAAFVDPCLYPIEYNPTKKRPENNIGCWITTMEMVYEPCYLMWGFGGGLLQWKNMMTAMERGKR